MENHTAPLPSLTNQFSTLDANLSALPYLTTCMVKDGFLALVLPVMYSLMFTISLLSNGLALWVFQFRPQRKSSMTVYMKNLAVSDLLLTLCLPFRVAYQSQPGPLLLCHIVGAFFYLNMYASIMFLSLISLDRYLKIIRPLQKFRIHSISWSTIASRLVWLLNLICMIPFFFEVRKAEPCSEKCFHFRSKGLFTAAINITAVACFYVLLLLFICSYAKISQKLCRVSLGRAQQQGRRGSTRAITKTFVVLVIFILCFVPYHVVRVPYVLAQLSVIPRLSWKQGLHIANEVVLCISALNSCLDPVIYFFLSNSFRKAVLCTLQGHFKKLFLKNSGTYPNINRSITEI